MLMVGLTGGIGAGKSAVAGRLVRRGAVLIDSDRLAREVVAAGTEGLAEVVDAFGPQVLGGDGELDRPALGARVFGDEPARRRLEAIIHPRVRARSAAMAAAAPPDAVVVNDVPLLVEVGMAASYHLVVVVEAEQAARVRRLAQTRGMAPEQAQARIAAQADDTSRRAAADVLLRNDSGLAELDELVDTLWRRRLLPYEHNLRHGVPARVPGGPPQIVGPDPTWPAQADRLIARIGHALRPVPGADAVVHHIGSTAVAGLPATDVIDLMLALDSLDRADAVAGALAGAGLPAYPGGNAPGRIAAAGPRAHGNADPARPVHLHMQVVGSPGWRSALLTRDHLRSTPAVRNAYAQAKRAWSADHRDADGYAAAKQSWCHTQTQAAERWAAETGWHPAL